MPSVTRTSFHDHAWWLREAFAAYCSWGCQKNACNCSQTVGPARKHVPSAQLAPNWYFIPAETGRGVPLGPRALGVSFAPTQRPASWPGS